MRGGGPPGTGDLHHLGKRERGKCDWLARHAFGSRSHQGRADIEQQQAPLWAPSDPSDPLERSSDGEMLPNKWVKEFLFPAIFLFPSPSFSPNSPNSQNQKNGSQSCRCCRCWCLCRLEVPRLAICCKYRKKMEKRRKKKDLGPLSQPFIKPSTFGCVH